MKLKTKADRSGKPVDQASHVTTGSVLDDLGFSPDEAQELKIKVDIWRALIAYIEDQGFNTDYLVRALKVHQPDVSNLLNGKIGRFSVGRLIQFAARLNLHAEVKITNPRLQSQGLAESVAGRAMQEDQVILAR